MHRKGSRHRAAESRLKEKELIKRDEANKRIALSGDSSISTSGRISSKPLLEQAQLDTSEVLSGRASKHEAKDKCPVAGIAVPCPSDMESVPRASVSLPAKEVSSDVTVQQHLLDYRERRERELKFTSAGWKRDGNGRWFKDENVSLVDLFDVIFLIAFTGLAFICCNIQPRFSPS